MTIEAVIDKASARLFLNLHAESPFLGQKLEAWALRLSGSQQPADYFKHPLAFPSLLLPWWFEEAVSGSVDPDFQLDLIYSSISGYYFIRLIDNVMDGDAPQDARLLPICGFLHTQLQATYQRYFPSHDHAFWQDFQRYGVSSAELAIKDADLADLDLGSFEAIAGQKVIGGKIPLGAVAYRCGKLSDLARWHTFFDRLGCWHQFFNDWLGWTKDLKYENASYFLSEGMRRKANQEAITAWVVREGFEWGYQLLCQWLDELDDLAERLNSQPVKAYLVLRYQLLNEQYSQLSKGIAILSQLQKVI